MGREPRIFDAGELYHLTAHGVHGLAIFEDDVDRQEFVVRLGRAAQAERWELYAACLLGTHYHLVLRPTLGRVSEGMRYLHGRYSLAYNKRRGRRGALFDARFAAQTIQDQAHLLEAIRYVALNPVRAGLVQSAADWPWSTYGQLVGTVEPWPFFDPAGPIKLFGGRSSLRDYVESERTITA